MAIVSDWRTRCDICGVEGSAGDDIYEDWCSGHDFCDSCLERLGLTTCAECGTLCAEDLLSGGSDCGICPKCVFVKLGEKFTVSATVEG